MEYKEILQDPHDVTWIQHERGDDRRRGRLNMGVVVPGDQQSRPVETLLALGDSLVEQVPGVRFSGLYPLRENRCDTMIFPFTTRREFSLFPLFYDLARPVGEIVALTKVMRLDSTVWITIEQPIWEAIARAQMFYRTKP